MLMNRSHTHLPSKEENLGRVTDKCGDVTRVVKFKKIDGKPGTYGAYTCNKCLGRMVWILENQNEL